MLRVLLVPLHAPLDERHAHIYVYITVYTYIMYVYMCSLKARESLQQIERAPMYRRIYDT